MDQWHKCWSAIRSQRWKKEGEAAEARTDVLNAGTSSNMRLICKRSVPALDADCLECREAKEALFRQGDGFLLYLSDGAPHPRERLLSLSSREALIWLNENEQDRESILI